MGLSTALTGHLDELWGLAVHPNLPQFITAGYDHTLNLWDSMSHSLVWTKDLPVCIPACILNDSSYPSGQYSLNSGGLFPTGSSSISCLL